MLKNYLTIAIRNLMRHKLYSVINIAGLAVGMAVCLLVFLWVQDELRYDRFHEKSDRIYRVLWDARAGDNAWTIPLGPIPVADALAQFPEVEQTVRFRREGRNVRHKSEYIHEPLFLFVENTFFDVFTVSFVAGDPETALNDPDAVILTQKTAQRYFPDQNPLGQTLELSDDTLLRVTGIVRDFPPQSHFHFDFLAPLQTLPIIEQRRTQWGSATVYAYVVLQKGGEASDVVAKLHDYWTHQVPGSGAFRPGDYSRFPLQPLTDIHLRSHFSLELARNGDIMHVYIFSLVAMFILLLACINFVNLATARAANRAREVGVRKVLGAHRTHLRLQFFVESSVCVGLATILALAISELGLPLLNSFAGKHLALGYASSALGGLAGIAALVAVLSGAYPAFFLSAYQPVSVLKTHSGGGIARSHLRTGLVIAQFAISIGLLIGTFAVQAQRHYMQSKKLGFEKEHVLIVRGIQALGNQYAAFREQLQALPQVRAASVAQSLPGRGFDSTMFTPEQPANYERTSISYATVDEHYVDVLSLALVSGRNFAPGDFPSDSTAFLINQAAGVALGWENPVGKRMTLAGRGGQVIGVVEDFHFGSLRSEIKPLVLPFLRWGISFVAIRLHPGNTTDAIAAVKQVWDAFAPPRPFDYAFLDQDYQRLYEGEQRMAAIFGIFSALAILIACLGLFGLAAFTAQQRTKEIGIRKVLGASVSGIVLLLSRDFVKLVLIANLIAWPVAYYAMNRWLENFAYRINLGWEVFALSGGLALLIALLTVSGQAWKAARANPVDALRNE